LAHHDDFHDPKNLLDSEADRPYLTELEGKRLLGEGIEPEMELDDLTTTLEEEGIDVSADGEMPSQRRRRLQQLDNSEDVELTPSSDGLEKTSDPVRLYLREMGTVPLLTREGEIEIARRFERGHFRALKAISRSPLAIREVLALGSDLQRGVRSIKDVVVFDEEAEAAPAPQLESCAAPGCSLPHPAEAQVHATGTQAPDGEGDRYCRHHAFARPADRESRKES
jgi:RNA polymerase primary sigma factor